MKKILSFILLACLSLVATAQSKPEALKTFLGKEHLKTVLQYKQQPARQQAQRVAAQPTTWKTKAYSEAENPTTNLDTTEVYFTSFLEAPIYIPVTTDTTRNGEIVTLGGDWLIVLENERYQFTFDFYGGTPETPAGTYDESNLDTEFCRVFFPEGNGKTHYMKDLDLTITEEEISGALVKYTLEATMVVTLGIEGPEAAIFKVSAEHKVIKAHTKVDIAILDCVIEPEEDRFRIYGKNDTMDVDLTFFTETGVEGYYTHKMMDDENYKLVYRNKSYEIVNLEGIITSGETYAGGMAYVFMYEALTSDGYLLNIAMEAPVVPTDTIEITSTSAIVSDLYGVSQQTITVDASTDDYVINAAYNATAITTPAEYHTGASYVYLTESKTGKIIESLVCILKIDGNKTEGYQVEIRMLGTDYKYYIMNLYYGVPDAKETQVINFKNNSKTMYYIDKLGLKELQIANFDGEYSASFDILYIDQVMDGEFTIANMFEEQTFLIHHMVENGETYDVPVKFAEFGGKIWQKNDTTYLTASILGFDSIQYEISMFYTIPTPTETVTYTFDGLKDDVVDLTNAVVSSGIFVLDAMSVDGLMMAKVNVERITTKSVEGTFYNDGKFDHSDFYAPETWVKVWNATTKDYDEYSVQKGTMTVEVEDNILTAVASFICDNAVQYDLTFITKYTRERIPFDKEDEDLDFTFGHDSYVKVTDWRPDGYRLIELFMVDADETVAADFYFVVYQDVAADPDIVLPAGVYPVNASWQSGTTLACSGVAADGPLPSYVCFVDAEGYLDPLNLWCMVDGTVTIEKVDGKMKVEVDALNSYDMSVKLHYEGAIVSAVENITTSNTNISKRIINGQMVIIRNGQMYNATGALVK